MMISGKFIIQGRSNNDSSTSNSKHKNLTCNNFHKKGHIRSECWLRKKKQPDANITELAEGLKSNATFYLLQTNQLVTKINGS